MEDKQGLTLEEIVKIINDMDEIAVSDPIIHDLIISSDYKARFVGEYVELKIRYNKLHKMLIKHEAGTLGFEPTCDISILEDQAYHMGNYLKQLEIRAEIEKITLPRI
jgi:hypothetical protein